MIDQPYDLHIEFDLFKALLEEMGFMTLKAIVSSTDHHKGGTDTSDIELVCTPSRGYEKPSHVLTVRDYDRHYYGAAPIEIEFTTLEMQIGTWSWIKDGDFAVLPLTDKSVASLLTWYNKCTRKFSKDFVKQTVYDLKIALSIND